MAARSFVRLTVWWAVLAVGLLAPAGPARADNFDIVPSYSGGFPESVKPAVEYATALWESWITNTAWGDASTLELTFYWQSLGAGVLGTAGVVWWGHAAGFAMTPAQYMVGTGIDSQGQDGLITFNSDQPWYSGTDGDPPSEQFDLVTVTLHEIGHQLGMIHSYRDMLLLGWGWGYMEGLFGDWHLTRWDTYLRDQDGDAPAPRGTTEYFDETGEVTLVSPTSGMANQGNPVPVYSPDPFEPASSLSHVYQSGDEDALMWPSISSGASRHGLYDYEAGIFTDLAWGFHQMLEVHATGVRDRRWHHGAAWAGGLPPAAGAAVYLDAAASSAYTVTLAKDASAGSLALTGPASLDIDAGTLTVSGAGSVQGASAQINVKGGTGLQTSELTIEDGFVSVSGGALDVTGTCAVDGQLELSSGSMLSPSLSVGDLYVGHGGSGTLILDDPAADIGVSGKLSFGPAGSLIAAEGAAIHMTGAALENQSADPAALAGLENLTVIVEGGGDTVVEVEVAGQDLGATPAGWEDNFVLGTLQLGGATPGRIRLVDVHPNHDPPADEALYVNDFLLDADATIDLNDLNLYFLNGKEPKQLFCGDANLDGAVDGADYTRWADHYDQAGGWGSGDFTADGFIDGADYTSWADNYVGGGSAIPEPGTLALLSLGFCLRVLRRRSRLGLVPVRRRHRSAKPAAGPQRREAAVPLSGGPLGTGTSEVTAG